MKGTMSRDVAGSLVLVAVVGVGTGAYASGHKMAGAVGRGVIVSSGTIVDLRSVTRLTSKQSVVGAPLAATALRAVLDDRGDTVIPVGAQFVGFVTAAHPAGPKDGRGKLDIAFEEVRFGDAAITIGTRVVSLGTHVQNRRTVSNPRGGEDIVLPAGGMIRLALTQPFAPGTSSAN